MEDIQDTAQTRRLPHHVVRRWPHQGARWKWQALPLQVAHHGMGTAQLVELLKHQPEAGLDLGIGVQEDLPVALPLQSYRKCLTEFPLFRFVLFSRMHPHLDMMELCLTHNTRKSQQQPIMV